MVRAVDESQLGGVPGRRMRDMMTVMLSQRTRAMTLLAGQLQLCKMWGE